MPHFETQDPTSDSDSNSIMAPQVNGDSPSSAFFSHLISFPLISDSISTFKSNPYGAKSLDITTNITSTLSNKLAPILSTPFSYATPYLQKADSIGDSTLSTLESKFPVVKKPTGELYSEGKSFVFFPLKKGNEGKDYVFSTFNGEIKKNGDQGLVGYGKAAVSTTFKVGGDAYAWLSGFLSAKKAEAKEVSSEKLNN